MEKLVDHKLEKMYRFQCSCYSPQDAMDVSVCEWEGNSTRDRTVMITMSLEPSGIRQKVKSAWQVLRGAWCWREFVVRDKDLKTLSTILDPDTKLGNMP